MLCQIGNLVGLTGPPLFQSIDRGLDSLKVAWQDLKKQKRSALTRRLLSLHNGELTI